MDKWEYMVANELGPGTWQIQGDDEVPYRGAQGLFGLLCAAGERRWELVTLAGNLVFKRPGTGARQVYGG